MKRVLLCLPIFYVYAETSNPAPLVNFIDVRKMQICEGDVFTLFDQSKFQFNLGTQIEKQILPFHEAPLPSLRAMLNHYAKKYRSTQFRKRKERIRFAFDEILGALKNGNPEPEIKSELEKMTHGIERFGKHAEKFENKRLRLSEIQSTAGVLFANVPRIGLGYEIYTRPDNYVEIWALWQARTREVKRIHTQPLLTLEAAAIHPSFFRDLGKGFFFEASEQSPPERIEVPLEWVGFVSRKVSEKHFYLLPDESPSSSSFNIRYLIDFMDLGCVTRLLLKSDD